MPSRPASPSQMRGDVDAIHPLYSYILPQDSFAHPASLPEPPQLMGRLHNSIDIVLASDTLYLRGTGADVEPSILCGSVVLNLAEATALKEITLQFRGKSRIPNFQNEGPPSVLGGSYLTNTVFVHDWSFLEGDRKHTPTLKAGRHVFPFQLQLEGWLPSTLSIHGGLGGIYYRLRATAVRPVFSSNLHAAASVRIVRSFASEALEYQQTLEVENTWPGKMMYSLMVPHKAWAAGDTVTTLIKLSPLLKGVRVANITSTVQEHLKTCVKGGGLSHDETRTITSAKHEIRDGHAVTVQLTDPGKGSTISPTPPLSGPSSPALSEGIRLPAAGASPPVDPLSLGVQHILGRASMIDTPSPEGGESSIFGDTVAHADNDDHDENPNLGDEEVVTTLPLTLPISSTPSHPLEPVVVTYRIRWSILMTNPDGHMSELRCSLPLHILDHALLDDARTATRATRRLLFGLEDAQPHTVEELELPSYPSHVLDRVANAYVPTTVRVSNPWVNPTGHSHTHGPSFSATLPGEPSSSVPLDWVNSELHRLGRVWPRSTAPTPPDSTQTSRHASRASSRAASPERGSGGHARERERPHHHHSIFSLKPFSKVASSLHPGMSRHHSSDGQTAHTQPQPQSQLSLSTMHAHTGTHDGGSGSGSGSESPVIPRVASENDMALLNRAFSEVPDYNVASRGFLGGGVTPLSSTRGLPSYEEVERTQSDGDLVASFAESRVRAWTS